MWWWRPWKSLFNYCSTVDASSSIGRSWLYTFFQWVFCALQLFDFFSDFWTINSITLSPRLEWLICWIFPMARTNCWPFQTSPPKKSTDDERFRTSSEEQCDLLLKMSTGASIGKKRRPFFSKDDFFGRRLMVVGYFPKTILFLKKNDPRKNSGPDSWKSVKDGQSERVEPKMFGTFKKSQHTPEN